MVGDYIVFYFYIALIKIYTVCMYTLQSIVWYTDVCLVVLYGIQTIIAEYTGGLSNKNPKRSIICLCVLILGISATSESSAQQRERGQREAAEK